MQIAPSALECAHFPRQAQHTPALPVQAEGYVGDENLGKALQGADLVVIPAGVPRKPGMTRDDLFNINAGIVKNLTKAIAQHAPNVSAQQAVPCFLSPAHNAA